MQDQDTIKIQLLEMECVYKLFAVQYQRLHKKSVENIHKRFDGPEYQKVLKGAVKHVKKCGVQGKQESTSRIAFHCAAYNCLAQCVLCTQKEGTMGIWNALFKEKLAKSVILWHNIIDLNVDLLLSVDTNFVWSLRRIKRRYIQSESRLGAANNLLAFDTLSTQSQLLINKSSLKQDFEQLSLSQCTQYSFQPNGNKNDNDNSNHELQNDKEEMDIDDEKEEHEIVLELDPLNKMPVMNTMLAVIDGLKQIEDKWEHGTPEWIASLQSKLSDTNTIQTHPNVRFFIAKLILNRPKVFEPFADLLFKPLVNLCITNTWQSWGFHYFLRDVCELFIYQWRSFEPDTEIDDDAQKFINHLINMVTDFGNGNLKNSKIKSNVNYINLLLAKWRGMKRINKHHLFCLLSVDISQKQFDKRKNVWNLKIGDTVLVKKYNDNKTNSKLVPAEVTKINQKGNVVSYRLKLPGNIEVDGVKSDDFKQRDFKLERISALWVIDALIEANIPAYDKDFDPQTSTLNFGSFFQAFCSNFIVNSRPVWKAAAKVYGDLLRKEEENIQNDPSFTQSFSSAQCVEKIKEMLSQIMGKDIAKAITIMHLIANEYPEFLDNKLIGSVLGSLARIDVKCLTSAISLFAKYVSVANPDPEVAMWLRPGLDRLFNHNEVDAHLALCDVLLRLIPFIKADVKQEYLPQFIHHFAKHPNSRVRRKLYGILSHVFDNEYDLNESLKDMIKDVLLSALADANTTNRKLMFQFWGNPTRLNDQSIIERLNDLLTKLFATKNEKLWLHYASFLLLEPMRRSPDFKQLIEHRPLSECAFEEMNVESQWGQNALTQNFAMTPMFSSSLPSSQKAADSESQIHQQTLLTFKSLMNGSQQPFAGHIRATQQREWTQTQTQHEITDHLPSPSDKPARSQYGIGKQSTFMWSQNVNYIQKTAERKNDENDQMVDLFEGSFANFEQGPQGKGLFGAQKSKIKQTKVRVSTPLLSQRFSAQKAEQRISSITHRHDHRKIYGEKWDEQSREAKAHRVTLYRKYRKGELPDIQIPHSDIQLPLQALHTDPVIAKELFIIFFKSIYNEAIKRSNRSNNLKQKIEQSMVHILENVNDHSSTCSTLLLCSTHLEDLKIEPKYIGDLAIKSNNLYSGVVLLEHLLVRGESIEERAKPNKRRRIVKKEGSREHDALSFSDKICSQLVRIYNLLGEQDTVLALSRDFAKMQETKDGVESYQKGNYWDAYNSYIAAQNISEQQQDRCTASILEKSLWKEESTKCLHKLAKWNLIYDSTKDKIKKIDKNKNFATNAWSFMTDKEELDLTEQSVLKSYFEDWILSSSKKEDTWKSELYRYIDEWLVNQSQSNTQQQEKKKFLERNFSPLLAFLYSTKNDFVRTKYYCTKSYEVILNKWMNLPRFAVAAKKILLSKLQSLVEIEEYVKIVNMELSNHSSDSHDSEDTLANWKRRMPTKRDDVLVWDNITFGRSVLGKKILKVPGVHHLKELITECRVNTFYASVNAMIYQKNYIVAKTYIAEAALLGQLDSKFKIQHLRLNMNAIVDNKKKTEKEKVQGMNQLNEKLTNYMCDDGMMNHYENEMCVLKGQILFSMAEYVDEDGTLLNYNIEKAKNVQDIYRASREFYRRSLQTFEYGQDSEDGKELKYAVDGDTNYAQHDQGEDDDYGIGQNDEGNAERRRILREHQYNHSKAYIELASFCNRRLLALEERARKEFERQNKANKIKIFETPREYSKYECDLGKEFIKCIMKAMVFNSDDARDMFPRVLEIAEMNVSELRPLINGLSQRIPCWMFLRWLAQMLAELGSPQLRNCTMPILLRIARMYSGAIMYPFNLTSEDLEDNDGAKPHIMKLKQILVSMPGYALSCAFTEALDCMCHPNLKFKDAHKEFRQVSKNKRLSEKDKKEKAIQLIRDMISDIFTPNKKFVGTKIGTENQRFIEYFGKKIWDKFGKKGEKTKRMALTTIGKVFKGIMDHKEKIADFEKGKKGGKDGGKLPLRKYSEWLSAFDSSRYDEALYVPGQFSGMVKPDTSNHLKIVSFDSVTMVMGSLRKPKRIKIRTDDEREQMWLVKAGEDLRMDERIEQMFKTMNNVLCKNTMCIERNLILRTYDVVPLNRSTGILEWIPNTKPIKSLIEDSMKRNGTKHVDIMKQYIEPMMKAIRWKKGHSAALYTEAISNFSKCNKKFVDTLRKIQNGVPATTLQLSIVHMAADKESYIQLRNRFCKTLAVYTICGYILGIGDRHLDNYLVDESTGQVIGIDFGAAFGYGLGLPVPELMPCRLTRLFLNIMHPLSTKLHIRNYMVTCLRALHGKKDNLLNIMNVFIKEPSLDWIELANRNFQTANVKRLMSEFSVTDLSSLNLTQNDASSSTQSETQKKEISWYPKHKIYIAKLKLNMYKSSFVMLEEINSTMHFAKSRYKEPMIKLINGWGANSKRKKYKNKCNSIEDQVDCIIDHADDDNILSVTWQGWGSWY